MTRGSAHVMMTAVVELPDRLASIREFAVPPRETCRGSRSFLSRPVDRIG